MKYLAKLLADNAIKIAVGYLILQLTKNMGVKVPTDPIDEIGGGSGSGSSGGSSSGDNWGDGGYSTGGGTQTQPEVGSGGIVEVQEPVQAAPTVTKRSLIDSVKAGKFPVSGGAVETDDLRVSDGYSTEEKDKINQMIGANGNLVKLFQ